LNRKHNLFSRTRPPSLLQRQNCVRADRLVFETVEKIVSDKVVPEVVIRTAAGTVTSIITTGSVERMNLKESDNVFAVIKATEVSVERE
jgi:molybdopterin-binding protein